MTEKIRQENKRRPFYIPKDRQFHYSDELTEGFHCLKIETKSQKSDKAILFLYGGGFTLAPDNGDVKTAESLGVRCGCDIWIPSYPLCLDRSVKTTFRVTYEMYRKMIQSYASEKIAFVGFSSGAALAIGLCLYNNAQTEKLPMPEVVIACSPGAVPLTEEEFKKMQALSNKDIMISAEGIKKLGECLAHGEELPKYMLSGIYGDFTGFPMTHFFYGSDEVLYASAESFAKAFDRYGAKYKIHVGQGMCHCYPMLRIFPEGKQANNEIIQIIKDALS